MNVYLLFQVRLRRQAVRVHPVLVRSTLATVLAFESEVPTGQLQKSNALRVAFDWQKLPREITVADRLYKLQAVTFHVPGHFISVQMFFDKPRFYDGLVVDENRRLQPYCPKLNANATTHPSLIIYLMVPPNA